MHQFLIAWDSWSAVGINMPPSWVLFCGLRLHRCCQSLSCSWSPLSLIMCSVSDEIDIGIYICTHFKVGSGFNLSLIKDIELNWREGPQNGSIHSGSQPNFPRPKSPLVGGYMAHSDAVHIRWDLPNLRCLILCFNAVPFISEAYTSTVFICMVGMQVLNHLSHLGSPYV